MDIGKSNNKGDNARLVNEAWVFNNDNKERLLGRQSRRVEANYL